MARATVTIEADSPGTIAACVEAILSAIGTSACAPKAGGCLFVMVPSPSEGGASVKCVRTAALASEETGETFAIGCRDVEREPAEAVASDPDADTSTDEGSNLD